MNSLKEILVNLFSPFIGTNFATLAVTLIMVVLWIGVAMIVVRILNRIVKSAINRKERDKKADTIIKLARSVVKVLVWFVVFTAILSEFGVDITPIIASAGVLGLAIGFGAQSIVKDFITGFFIVLEESFFEDDVVSINGFKGTVVKMGLKTTRVRDWTGKIKIINNGDITDLINFSKEDSLAIVDFGVSYDTDLKKVNQMMEKFMPEIKKKYENIVESPVFLGVTELADSSINMRIIAKTKPNEHFPIERGIRADIIELFNKEGIEIPFPQVVVHQNQENK